MATHPIRALALAGALTLWPAAAGVAGAAQVGRGTPASCTSAAVVSAVARGGVVTFDCGPAPVTIVMRRTAKVRNTNRSLVIDGGGLVTLSGGGRRRILYQNTCDRAQVWTTSHCDDQATPRLVVRNLGLRAGNATGQTRDGGGGGAIFARGGRLTIIGSRFTGNRCDRTGPDVGGAAVRALSQYRGIPLRVVRSTFIGGRCSNGGALSSIGVSWTITDSTFSGNRATGRGANPSRAGAPGGGSGGAIYLDGNRFTLTLRRSVIEDGTAREGGGAIFFVSNDRTGTATLAASTLRRNRSLGFETRACRGSSSWVRGDRRSSGAPGSPPDLGRAALVFRSAAPRRTRGLMAIRTIRRPVGLLLAGVIAAAVLAPSAVALPGDAAIAPLTPAEGAVLPTGGIAVTYACPVYRSIDLGDGFAYYGTWSSYGVSLATSPELGADGRLRQDRVVATDSGHQPNTLPADQCAGSLGTGRADGPENTPGTYYWQAYRVCGGCGGGYDAGEVRALSVRAQATLAVGRPGPAFAGYPVAVPLSLKGVPDGATVALQRRAGSRFRTLGTTSARSQKGEVIVTLPSGIQRLRVSARLGTQDVASAVATVRVRPAGSPRVTASRDDGAWRGARPAVSFTVGSAGRTIRGFRAAVTMLCPQVGLPGGQGQLTTQAGFAAFRRARIAPDGRFIASAVVKGSAVLVRGRLRAGRLTGGAAVLSVGTCTGTSSFTARRAGA